MRDASVWQRVLGLTRTVVVGVRFDEGTQTVVASVRPHKACRRRCGRCGKRAGWYDRGEGTRRWRALDLGSIKVWVEADAPRVNCRQHGPTVVQVPWARHGVGHTRAFDDTVAWLAVQCSKSAVTQLLRIAWRTVGSILSRVQVDLDAGVDRLDGLRRIGIDEISYKSGHRYLTVVVDHDRRQLVWAAPGRDARTLAGFFDRLGPHRCAAIAQVSADGADWIERTVHRYCPQATVCADPFHVVAWTVDAMDAVRRQVLNDARGALVVRSTPASGRRADRPRRAHRLKQARWALWKNPANLTTTQHTQLDWVATSHPDVWRAYLLKEGLRTVFEIKGEHGKHALDHWIAWARRSRLAPFVELQRRISRYRPQIDAALDSGLSNALTESTNTKIRLIIRRGYGFKDTTALIALAMLALGTNRPTLPGRT